jgi:ribosomal protein S27E
MLRGANLAIIIVQGLASSVDWRENVLGTWGRSDAIHARRVTMRKSTFSVACCIALCSIGTVVAVVFAGQRGTGGACCFPDGTCENDTSQTGCELSGGIWQGSGTFCGEMRGNVIFCEPFGACCIGKGQCTDDTTQEFCEVELQGVWAGAGTFCVKDNITGVNNEGAPLQGGVSCGAPVNDDCEDAIHIASFDGPVFGTVEGATDDFVPDCELLERGFSKAGVWYSVTGTGSIMTANVCGLLDDFRGPVPRSVLFVYCGGCENPQCVAGDGGSLQTCDARILDTVQWCGVLGEEYLIFVALEDEITTEFVLTVTDTGQPCQGIPCGVPNDECEGAILITPGGTFGSTVGATFDDVPICADPDSFKLPGVWYKVIGTGDFVALSLCAANIGRGETPGEINVYCGGCENLQCVAGDAGFVLDCIVRGDSDVSVEWCSEEGVEYHILVMYPATRIGFFLEYSNSGKPCEPKVPCGTALNDFCETATPICPGILYTGDTFEATNDYLDHGAPINTVFFCGALMALYDVWYSYTPTEAGLLFVHVEQLPTEWVFGVYDDCPENGGHLLNCNITRHHGVIVVPVQPYHTYYIRIAGFLESRGDYIMDILGPPCAAQPINTNLGAE